MGIALVVIGVLTSVVALYYYLIVIRTVYTGQPEGGTRPLLVTPAMRAALIVCMVGILFFGFVLGPAYTVSTLGAQGLFSF